MNYLKDLSLFLLPYNTSMGCLNAREHLSSEEIKIVSMESQLEYYKNSCTLIDSVHRKYSTDGLINEEQWKDIRDFLQFRVTNTLTCLKIESFYESLKESNKFKLSKMALLGILLGHGIPRQKARLLFELYDPGCKGLLSLMELQVVFNDIHEICVQKLVKLADYETGDFVELLNQGFEKKKEGLFYEFMKGEEKVSREKFIRCFESKYPGLLNPHGFRKFCGLSSYH